MTRKTALLLAGVLSLAGVTEALVRSPEAAALPNYDVRSNAKGLLLGSAPGRFREAHGGAVSAAIAIHKSAALARIRALAGDDVVVRWNALNEAPKMLFRYDRPLTKPDPRDAAVIAYDFLREYADLFGLESDGVDAFQVTRRFQTMDGTLEVLHFEQYVAGVNLFHGEVRFAVTPQGEIASASASDIVRSTIGLDLAARVADRDAVRWAASFGGVDLAQAPARLNPSAERVGRFEKGPLQSEPTLETVLFPMGKTARLAYRVVIEPATMPAAYEIIVDAADGGLLFRHNMTQYAQTDGLVFKESPLPAPGLATKEPFFDTTVKVDPRWPLGWAFNDQTIGNVVDAKEDRAGDNEAVAGQRSFDFTPGPPIYFQDPWVNSYELTGIPAINDIYCSTTTLFYFANIYHDWLYGFGFDEASGNWQKDNYGRGGRENDWLYVDAQDSGGLPAGPFTRNNANMSTPPDGAHPRAQFFLFTNPPFARRDSGVDGDIVLHEFSHGLSNRLVGGANSTSCLGSLQSGSMGEGWADFYAAIKYNNPVIGEYATGDTVNGIRTAPYNSYPACRAYNGVNFCEAPCSPGFCALPFCGPCEVHDEGELWAVTLWEMKTLFEQPPAVPQAISVVTRIVTDGLKLTPCNPSFLDARDAILLADRYAYAGVHECLIWEAFAGRSMGWGATTNGGDDTMPVGSTAKPPFCLTQGSVAFDRSPVNATAGPRARYSCNDTLIVTVHDMNAGAGPLDVVLTTSNGDNLAIKVAGVAPTYVSGPISVLQGVAVTSNTILEVQPGGTITADYADANPAALAQATSDVDCSARVEAELKIASGCAADTTTWPGSVNQILDAGEVVNATLIIHNTEPKALTNVAVTMVSPVNTMIVSLTPSPVAIASIDALTGNGVATFRVAASRFLPAGSATLSFTITADGYSGSQNPITFNIPVHSNYQTGTGTTGVVNFDANDGGYVHLPWPPSAVDEWVYGVCPAFAGRGWHAGSASCAGNAAEQDAVLQSAIFNPTTATRVSWYPTALSFQHKLTLGGTSWPNSGDAAIIAVTEPNFAAGGDWGGLAILDARDNTATFQPLSLTLTAADTLGAGLQNEKGLIWWFDFFTNTTSFVSSNWDIDDVEMKYDVLDAAPQAGFGSCVQGGYWGTAQCTPAAVMSAYNTLRPAELQRGGTGRFWVQGNDYHLFDVTFPTPSQPDEITAVLGNANANDGAHAGTMIVNALKVRDTTAKDFSTAVCTPIPRPNVPTGFVVTGQPVMLSWTGFVESGTERVLAGYKVYRINSDLFPAATSRIADYTGASGFLAGTTVGQPDINKFIDTAPAVPSGNQAHFTYTLQPVFTCDPLPCLTPVVAEIAPGVANLSTDSDPVTVSVPLAATFESYGAARQGTSVLITWTTSKELDTLSYEIYRGSSLDASTFERVGGLAADGRPATYRFVDESAPAGVVFYQIREISLGIANRTGVFGTVASSDASTGRGRRVRSRSTGSGGYAGEAGAGKRGEGRLR